MFEDESSKCYQKMKPCLEKEYVFLVKINEKEESNRKARCIIAQEVRKVEEIQPPTVETEETGRNKVIDARKRLFGLKSEMLKKKMKMEPNLEPFKDIRVCIATNTNLDQRVYNTPTSNEVAAIWIEGNNSNIPFEREIVIHEHSGQRHYVKHYYGCYDPLQYPLLFPKGVTMPKQSHVSCREYYSYKLQIRESEPSVFLLVGRLLQQFVVDMYIKLETTRLDYFRNKQSEIRAEVYQGIMDSLTTGETRGDQVGQRVILPASFIGGPRDMRRRYMDAMALVQRFGKPDIFITMTCNPDWKEIKDKLLMGQVAQDRPDLTSCVFHSKLEDLKDQLFKKNVFGRVGAHVYVIEFQKRGLPHAHILVILKEDCKILTPDQFNKYISAEIPDVSTHPRLHEMVVKHMTHGPCGKHRMDSPCMVNQECRHHYPRPFSSKTIVGKDSYPIYMRRNNGSERSSKTMLTEFFTKGTTTENARQFLYVEFPEHYVWNNQAKIWSDRKHKLVIGRINAANPKEGERYYLCLLLNHVSDLTSCEYLLTVDGIASKSFKEAAQKRGLLEADDSISDCLVEATTFQMPYALRRLFAIILVYFQPSNVRKLWNDHFKAMAEDFKGGVDEYMLPARVAWTLKSISLFLESMGKHIADYDLPLLIHDDVKHIADYDLPLLIHDDVDQCQTLPIEIIDEREIDIPFEDFYAQSKLNPRQKQAFDIILDRVNKKKSGIFFVDGPGGTAIMPGGRTAHSRFKIPITANETTMCNISKQDGTSKLIRLASLIIWDEAPMAKRFAIETVDRTLRDVMGDKRIFGGKVVVFGGDFRQVLPIVPRGTRAETVNASLVKSYLWEKWRNYLSLLI
ncbi:uncharacterized protein LOC109829733 [Asparagus officinalis]|uniref:uncharacterized protein LOC109829733 n=1 Tax=Asparagus officinalis TaxID=4686 RepID=UPI00098E2661|nr:uncharacterized protein LOC109829733 [Asparagus officinalis]